MPCFYLLDKTHLMTDVIFFGTDQLANQLKETGLQLAQVRSEGHVILIQNLIELTVTAAEMKDD